MSMALIPFFQASPQREAVGADTERKAETQEAQAVVEAEVQVAQVDQVVRLPLLVKVTMVGPG
jgi:hypothetical protein